MVARPSRTWLAFGVLACLAATSCQGTAPGSAPSLVPVTPSDARGGAYQKLRDRLDTFHVSGAVKTSEGLLLPENIAIEIKSEICVESRLPGARFWSLDYDTCFVFVARDSVDETGGYSVSVPCLDADLEYESRHSFGDLRLVQKGPVSFFAESDAGWRHQETFTSSRTQRRDLILTLEPETFWIVHDGASFRERPLAAAPVIRTYDFGADVPVIRFHAGWAQAVKDGRIGWIEMRYLGTEEEMKEAAPPRGGFALTPEEIVVDARGLLCPIPVVRLTERIADVAPGATLLLLADDPAAEDDVRLWCRGRGHELLEVAHEGPVARIRVRRAR